MRRCSSCNKRRCGCSETSNSVNAVRDEDGNFYPIIDGVLVLPNLSKQCAVGGDYEPIGLIGQYSMAQGSVTPVSVSSLWLGSDPAPCDGKAEVRLAVTGEMILSGALGQTGVTGTSTAVAFSPMVNGVVAGSAVTERWRFRTVPTGGINEYKTDSHSIHACVDVLAGETIGWQIAGALTDLNSLVIDGNRIIVLTANASWTFYPSPVLVP